MMGKMKKETRRQIVGRILKQEGGKSQAKMGDAMQIENMIFEEIVKNPSFLAEGIKAALKRIKKRG